MKTLFLKRAALVLLFVCSCFAKNFAESTVYFFVDFRFTTSEYVVKVNGQEGFKLVPEISKQLPGMTLYTMVARKVIFPQEDTYVLTCDIMTGHGMMTAEANLNVEDGQTYYVLFNANMKNPFFAELLTEKEGMKMLKKATGNKKYTFNEDLVYEAK